MSWSWSPVPQRLMALDTFLELDDRHRMILLMLYLRCDRWGRGPTGARSLGVLIGVLDIQLIREALVELTARGFVEVPDASYWQLVGYDDDMPTELKRKRGESAYGPRGAPAQDQGRTKGALRADQGRPDAGPTPDELRPDAGPESEDGRNSGGSGPREGHPQPAERATPDRLPDVVVSSAVPSGEVWMASEGRVVGLISGVAAVFPAEDGPKGALRADQGRPKGGPRAPLDETRRDETRLDSSVPEGGPVAAGAPARPPARAHTREATPVPNPSSSELALEPAWTPPRTTPTWPPGTEEPARRWWARLQETQPMGSGFTLADVQRVAIEHPETFAAAVESHLAGAKGWKRCDQVAWLTRQCQFQAERQADAGPRGSRGRDDLPAVRKPPKPFAGWDFRWDPVPADTPGIDPVWPSALDLPEEQHQALAWVTHSPSGPVSPPARLWAVPGALEAYSEFTAGRGAA